ncbi:MAG: hypothetical protein AAGJ18_08975 [Bacteroidota bacterium]
MNTKLEKLIGKNDKKYIKILRLLHLIDGVNQSLENSKKMDSTLMEKQYMLLKEEYTQELLEELAEYRLPVTLKSAA